MGGYLEVMEQNYRTLRKPCHCSTTECSMYFQGAAVSVQVIGKNWAKNVPLIPSTENFLDLQMIN